MRAAGVKIFERPDLFSCTEDGVSAVEANKEKLAFLFRYSAQAANIRVVDTPVDHEKIQDLVRERRSDEP